MSLQLAEDGSRQEKIPPPFCWMARRVGEYVPSNGQRQFGEDELAIVIISCYLARRPDRGRCRRPCRGKKPVTLQAQPELVMPTRNPNCSRSDRASGTSHPSSSRSTPP